MDVPTTFVGGVKVGVLSRAEWANRIATECINRRTCNKRPLFLSSVNGNVLSLYARSQPFRKLLDQADALDADGMPVVIASCLLSDRPIPERCATTDFFHELAAKARDSGLSFFLLGGTDAISRKAVMEVQRLYPGLKIVGRHHGYFTKEDESNVIAQIINVSPDVLWIGLGVPKEQDFVVRNRSALKNVGVIKTCGGLFDFVSGKNTRAPRWMQNLALEWLYRAYLEPRRLLRRYLTTNIHAIWLILTQTRKQ